MAVLEESNLTQFGESILDGVRQNAVTLFMARLNKSIVFNPSSGCWLWTKTINSDGYALIWIHNKSRSAHRFMYQFLVGEIPDGLELDHLCRTRNCVNPEHLEPVTHVENMRRVAVLNDACRRGHERSEFGFINNNGNIECRICSRMVKTKSQRRIRASEKEARNVRA